MDYILALSEEYYEEVAVKDVRNRRSSERYY